MISVCMATYNGERYLRRQVESILSQLADVDELIVSDDGSTDGTPALLESLADPRLRILHNNGKRGVNANFDNALRHAKGDYIFLADQDDVWLPGKVSCCLRELQEHICVVHDAFITDGNLQMSGATLFSVTGTPHPGVWRNIMRNSFTGCCMAFRAELLRHATPIPSAGGFYHDQWLGLVALRHGTVAAITEPLILFRRNDSSASSAGCKSRLSLFRKLKYRAMLAATLCPQFFRK